MSAKTIVKEDKNNEKIKVVDLKMNSDINNFQKEEMNKKYSKNKIITECIMNLICFR